MISFKGFKIGRITFRLSLSCSVKAMGWPWVDFSFGLSLGFSSVVVEGAASSSFVCFSSSSFALFVSASQERRSTAAQVCHQQAHHCGVRLAG